MNRMFCLPVFLFCCAARADELTVLPPTEPDARVQMLRDYLRGHVHQALDERRAAYEARSTREQISQWQNRLREKFIQSLGGFPRRTPLKARVVGRASGKGYRIEKVIYESRPGFLVTAVLYLPGSRRLSTPATASSRGARFPAVLLPCGHSENGKAAGSYQRASILLAQNGLAVLCYDPVGQGERKQILKTQTDRKRSDADDEAPAWEAPFRATTEHTLSGVAPILLGKNLATYRIWDGMRGIDYLLSRDDIDPSRIGCTGNSGGGLMTSYLAALDDRIKAAAPGCFITATRFKNESPGPGDAEQNIFAQTAYGLDHPDYLMLAAPRSVLICSATRDFVPIEGAWKAFRQAKRLYTRLGVPERIGLVEADERHGFTRPLRIAATRWMRRWLLGRDDPITEPELEIHSEGKLRCTPKGQVLLMPGARSLFDLYRERAKALAEARAQWWNEASREQRIEKVRQLAAIRKPGELSPPEVRRVGTVQRDGYRIEKLALHPEKGIVLPALLFEPAQPGNEATLYLHGEGKQVDAGPGGSIEKLVQSGQRVLAVDLRGYGETETTPWRFSAKYFGPNAAEYFIAYTLGRSLVGMRAEDVLTSAAYLATKDERKGGWGRSAAESPAVPAGGSHPCSTPATQARGVAPPRNAKLHLVAVGRAGIPALHAAAVAPQRFASLKFKGTLDSWQRVIETPVTVDQLENTVHGALRYYDLPELIEMIGHERVRIESPRDAAGR